MLSAMILLNSSQCIASDTPQITVAPDWDKVTWESRYDNAKVLHIQLNAKSLLPDQLAAVTEVDATFRPSQGQEMVLDGGLKYGGYVFDNWDQLVKRLEALVGGISITQTAFYPENSLSQSFALTPDEQNKLLHQKGVLTLKVTCELWQLKLKVKIPLNAPSSIKSGSELFQFAPTGDTARLEVSRTGPIDPNDHRPSRTLVFLLVDPDNHTATLLQEVAPNGFFTPGRDPTKPPTTLNLVYQLGVTPGKTPIDHEILYIFDTVLGDTTEATVSDPNFEMQWP
jgi:hypothetical protein